MRRAAGLAVLVTLAVGGLAAQGEVAPDLHELRRTVALATNVDSLRAWETRTIALTRDNRGDPRLHLELGFVALRLGELTGHTRRFEDAQEEFELALAAQPLWWVGHYGRAMAIIGVRGTELGVITALRKLTGHDAEAAAAKSLAQSAALDSLRATGLVAFARRALEEQRERELTVARLAIEEVGSGPAGRLRDIRMLRGAVERALDRNDLALLYLAPLLEEFPNDPEIEWQVALSRFVSGRTDGALPWFAGLTHADSVMLEQYRRDLVLIMPDSTLTRLVSAPAGDRAEIASAFFRDVNDVELPAAAERLRDHYRRLNLARLRYPRREFGEITLPLPGMRTGSEEFDARGVVTVLHGVPTTTGSLSLPGFLRNESWAYARNTGDTLLFHFVFLKGQGDAVALESALDLFTLSGQARFMSTPRDTLPDGTTVLESYGASLTAQTTQELLASRESLAPIYGKMFDEGRDGAVRLQPVERAMGTRSLASGATWSLEFENRLKADLEIVAAGEAAGGRLIHVAYAIPGSSLVPIKTVQGAFYRIRLRVAVRDTGGKVVAALDTTRTFRTNGVLEPHERLVGRSTLVVAPGEYDVRAVLETEWSGLNAPATRVHVAPMQSPTLVLSELVLGTRRVPLPVAIAAGDTAWIDPGRSFRRGTPMQFALEIGGLPEAAKYRVEMTVVRSGTGGFFGTRDRNALTLAFDGVHPGGVTSISREVALNRLEPGAYRIDVAVIGPDGTRRVRQREFTVVK